MQLYQHLDFALWPLELSENKVLVVLHNQVCRGLLQQRQKTNTLIFFTALASSAPGSLSYILKSPRHSLPLCACDIPSICHSTCTCFYHYPLMRLSVSVTARIRWGCASLMFLTWHIAAWSAFVLCKMNFALKLSLLFIPSPTSTLA